MSIFKPKGSISLQSPDFIVPGESIPIEIRIKPEEDLQPRGIRVELIGEQTYYKETTHLDSKGRPHRHIVAKTDTFTSISQTLADQPVLSSGVEQKWNCSLQLPPTSPPTCLGKVVNIRYTLKAVVDVPKRADLSHEKALLVLCPPSAVSMPALPAEQSFNEVKLILKAPQSTAAGSSLKGQLMLQIKENLNIRSIRIELVLSEEAGARKDDNVIYTTRVPCAAAYRPTDTPSFEFSLDIPAEAPPTVAYSYSKLRWIVKAVIDRKMKSDFNVEQELFICSPSRLLAK